MINQLKQILVWMQDTEMTLEAVAGYGDYSESIEITNLRKIIADMEALK